MNVTAMKLPRPAVWKVGDVAWIFIHPHQGERTKGRVVAVLDLEGWLFPNYVIEIPTAMDPLLEVRSGFCMWPSETHRT